MSGCLDSSGSENTQVYISQEGILFRKIDGSVTGQIKAGNVSVTEGQGSVDQATESFVVTDDSGRLSFENGTLEALSFEVEEGEADVHYNAEILETNSSRFSYRFDEADTTDDSVTGTGSDEVLDSSVLEGAPSYIPGREKGYYVWQDTNDRVHVSWTGDTKITPRRYAMKFEISTEAEDVVFENLDSIDFGRVDRASITSGGGKIVGVAGASSGEDKIAFDLDSQNADGNVEVTFDLKIGVAYEGDTWLELTNSQKTREIENSLNETTRQRDLVFLGSEKTNLSSLNSSLPFTVRFG